jgi:hypothetical protein
MGSVGITSCPLRGQVDPRALRFNAAATASVLAVVMLTVGPARPRMCYPSDIRGFVRRPCPLCPTHQPPIAAFV